MRRSCFEGSHISALYKQYRPQLPTSVVNDVISYMNEKLPCPQNLCVDLGCGPGQSTELFCPFFKGVVGLDDSTSQIQEAISKKQAQNVSYVEGNAESTPFESGSVALVVAVNALHYFDRAAFFQEAARVLMANGVLFAAMYHLRRVLLPGLENILDDFRADHFKDYRTSKFDYWSIGYADIDFPFQDVRRREVIVKVQMTLPDAINVINTWSVSLQMKEKEPDKYRQIVDTLENRVSSRLEELCQQDKQLEVGLLAYYVLCRK